MALKYQFCVLLMIFLGISSAASVIPSYTIVSSKMMKPGSNYQFSLTTTNEMTFEFLLEASIKKSDGSALVQNKFTLQTNVAKLLNLEIPAIVPEDTYTFSVSASGGITFVNSSQLSVNRKVHSIFIQTDKVLYKPGQTILFRVISITPDLKPYTDKVNITIYDTALNKIKKLVDQQSENGVITDSLKLSDITSLGQWKIHAESQLIDGKGDLSLTLTDLKALMPTQWVEGTLNGQTLFVEANVTETETGITLSGNSTIDCKSQRLKLEFLANSPDNYKPGLTFNGYLSLKNSDDSPPTLSDIKNSDGSFKTITIKSTTYYYHSNIHTNYEKIFTVPLTENGYVIFNFPTLLQSENVNFEASFRDEVTDTTLTAYKYVNKFETRDKGGIQITLINTENIIKPSTILQFQVKTVDAIKDFQLQMLAKGLIIESKQMKFPSPQKEHIFSLEVTAELAIKLAPEARFVVSYVSPTGELIADSLSIPVADFFANKVSLSFNKDKTEPGDDNVYLNVKTKENSFVGLLAVDQSVMLLSSGNDVTQDMIKSELSAYSELNYDGGHFGGLGRFGIARCLGCWSPFWLGGSDTYSVIDNAGLSVMSNLHVQRSYRPIYWDLMMNAETVAVPDIDGPSVSSTPATTTVRKDFPETWICAKGDYQLKVKVPDTITSWVATGFSVNQEAGIGLSESSAKITVIKPFFISLNLPYSIVRGEEFALQVTVFNYFGQDLEAQVKLLASNYFKVIKCDNKELQSVEVVKHLKVGNNDGKSVYFWVVATAIGQIPIEVSAHAGLAADAMKATLLVKVSDIIGSAMNNIGDLLKMPYGCGEQNLLHLVPDVYLLKYFTETGRLTQEFDQKAKNFINDGYQRELTYQRLDGSFSAFGNSDKAGSIWLSSFVIKCFHQAKEYIPVEDSKIAATMNWIIGLQGTDGTFAEPPEGKVIHKDMQGGSSSGIALTAYVLIALLENKNNPMTNSARLTSAINNANKYLENNFHSYSNDPYALAIISYALHKSGSLKLTDTLALLDKLAINKDGVTYWKKDVIESTSEGIWRGPYSQAKSYNIEIASYVLMVYAEKKDFSKSIPIGKWLLKQRNAFGGFASTQDTVLGLEALASFAPLIIPSSDGAGITVTVTDESGSFSHTFDTVTRQNALFQQSIQLPQSTSLAYVLAKGEGVALVQMNVNYNVENDNKDQFLTLDLSTRSSNNDLSLSVSTSWSGSEVTGMVVVEINILTGYSLLDDGNFIQQIGSTFKKVEKSSNKVVIYLDELTSQPLKFDVLLQEQLKIANVKPALVKVYRYYEPGTPVTGFYSTVSGQTWEGACPQCC
ncbi:hypothetical protein HELRODRAFT_180052 [Helobdella robusta]|uniref:Uncharacterized protein n=1 Tax=Helobdella robusta TaxID=6412 RepID=T1FFE6_HELRO|nr:hypothetical protein HELRODRAFT_180052 [Helobdella robusta]ESN94945.1 hypothetical protein HELRODRAFT_180052 [Helobdella robusta]